MKRLNFRKLIPLIPVMVLLVTSCQKDDDRTDGELIIRSEFSEGEDGWIADFAEYNGDNVEIYELEEGITNLPEPLDTDQQAYRISGVNRSDDLFMYLKRQVTDLKPLTTYRITFTVEFASNARSGGVGVGGAPGESVGMGVGASFEEPVSEPNDNNFYEMNIGKINQCCTDGEDMVVIGDVANGTEEYVYTMLSNTGEFVAQTDDAGSIWVIVGTDSGFEGETALYYTSVEAVFKEL
ncbi:hypothetical protein H8S90_16630 [Olivibacter sp. SDN3]|uniref:hypothetical protein n=1 Tax=Olivibacter sp. SDN3 TaxID=2764720 RepID=UPI00165180DB|nr:hypothetical protein [Olivibacter sp. SDN3]QNL48409.1 hypothetical protein H8S90_16630 [Olivibacter sp. SDN3]